MISEAQRFWDAIVGKVRQVAQDVSKNAFRCERYEVTTAPNGSKIGVTLPLGTKEIFLPYSVEVENATVGSQVLVVWWGSMSNAKVYYYANGYRGTRPAREAYPVGAVFESTTLFTTTQLSQMLGGTWVRIFPKKPEFVVEEFTIELESIAAGGVVAVTDYDISDSPYAEDHTPLGIVGFGVTGASGISVNRVMLNGNYEVSYLLRNNSSSASPPSGSTADFQFYILWYEEVATTPYKWERIA